MIRRVARAICCPPHGSGCAAKQDENGYAVCQAHTFEKDARSAIEALREPTEEMVQASNREWDGRMSHRSSGAWQAMIDAALTPPHDGGGR